MVVEPVARGRTPAEEESRLAEITKLCEAIALQVRETLTFRINRINPGLYLGRGAAEKLRLSCESKDADIVVFNGVLSPVQQRNLEKACQTKVIDRTGLILEIFGERAQTKEGRIQVELAALEYQKSRLVKSWTHLERQRGGLGKTGGPGETQLEIDRRLITKRIGSLKKDLEKIRKTRDLGRKSRERVPFPIVALVGYTNAGKSTLFNRLTGAQVFAEDLLFATLDPTMRKIELPGAQPVILSDTVGFISDLPTSLIEAFKSTLEQVEYADIILHVRDISEEDHESQKQDVIKVLQELGIEYESDTRIIEVLNKIDLLEPEQQKDIMRKASFNPNLQAISAVSGQGIEERLIPAIEEILNKESRLYELRLPFAQGQALAWLYDHGQVLDRKDVVLAKEEGAGEKRNRITTKKEESDQYADADGETFLTVRLSPRERERFQELFPQIGE